eukprot:COSAG01_NODE_8940_length_2608_cov_1.708250_3_plen_52_part_00
MANGQMANSWSYPETSHETRETSFLDFLLCPWLCPCGWLCVPVCCSWLLGF